MPVTLSRRSAGRGSAQAKSKHRQGCYNTPPATGASAVARGAVWLLGLPRRACARARAGASGATQRVFSIFTDAEGSGGRANFASGWLRQPRRTVGLRPRPGRRGVPLTAERGWARQGQASPWPMAQACRAGRRASTRSALGQPLSRLEPEPQGAFAFRVGHRGEALTPARLSRTLPAAWGPARIGAFSGRGEIPHRRYATPVASPRAPSLRKGRADQVQGLSRRLKSG
jgi:hypothetical protein